MERRGALSSSDVTFPVDDLSSREREKKNILKVTRVIPRGMSGRSLPSLSLSHLTLLRRVTILC